MDLYRIIGVLFLGPLYIYMLVLIFSSTLLLKYKYHNSVLLSIPLDFPGGPVIKNLPANVRDTGSISCLGRFLLPWAN